MKYVDKVANWLGEQLPFVAGFGLIVAAVLFLIYLRIHY